GHGLDAGFNSDGKLFVGNPASGVPVDLSAESVLLHLTIEPRGEQSAVTLAALTAEGREIAKVSRDVASSSLAGNLALVANFGAAAPGNGAAKAAQKAKKAKAKAADGAADAAA